MKKQFNLLSTLFVVGLIFLVSCGGGRQVTRIDKNETIDLSGKWNDTDARLVAEEMISDVLKRPWIDEFLKERGKKPVVIVGSVRNKSSEHIEVDMFTKEMEKELLNSGRVSFVATKDEREQVRDERADQQKFSSEESMKQFYKEKGADYLLLGVINSVEDKLEGEKVIKYKVNLELIDVESNTKVWIGDKEIKKYIGQDKYGY
ncbi:MAG: penicillin-binding protein activator LpoB [Melioribacteraceae bacterium]|nr:penicillin-binding protein activator LpoB [Melioribacteraceae bacterium]